MTNREKHLAVRACTTILEFIYTLSGVMALIVGASVDHKFVLLYLWVMALVFGVCKVVRDISGYIHNE